MTPFVMGFPVLLLLAALFSPLIAMAFLAMLPAIALAIPAIIVIEVVTRRISPWALLIPVFGFYVFYGAQSSGGKAADQLLEKMSRQAAVPVVPISYDPAVDGPIVFNGDFTLADEGSGSEVSVFVSRWDAPVVFTQKGRDYTAWLNASETVCARAEEAARGPGSPLISADRRTEGRCVVSLRATPPPGVVDVFGQIRYPGSYKTDTVLKDGAYLSIHTVDVRKKGGSAHLLSGYVHRNRVFLGDDLLPFGQQETKERRVGRVLGLTENRSRLVEDDVGIRMIEAEASRAVVSAGS